MIIRLLGQILLQFLFCTLIDLYCTGDMVWQIIIWSQSKIIIAPDKRHIHIVYFNQKKILWYSLEVPWGTSNEYHNIFFMDKKKKSIRTFQLKKVLYLELWYMAEKKDSGIVCDLYSRRKILYSTKLQEKRVSVKKMKFVNIQIIIAVFFFYQKAIICFLLLHKNMLRVLLRSYSHLHHVFMEK